MNTKDIIVILLLVSVVLWAILHQLASKYINKSSSLKRLVYGSHIYKNKSLDVANIESIIVAITMINIISFFSGEKFSNFFVKRKFLIFSGLNYENCMLVIKDHQKLWFYIKISSFFMIFIVIFSIFFWLS
ncbi:MULTISPECIES: hypothetical protein [Acinetobacter]|uniref:hypothetical protein n=1 Tax=Acinetobacter TaxID=469 RepID=UPI00097F6EE2|nr:MULTISPECIES: hypothetical protein [Acinetobacter]MEB3796245.1 hypothetical protein [Acinetobacter sp. IK24]MEB3815433.1 hypothetical protein [Acinetobacter sp. IK22]MEB3834639.1 hypothetical protein [Acinetobacter sp. IK23]MEB3839106.1 hypothetical protein [Acinetobacter sp. IK25]ONN57758.1 hypothetical protein AC057_06980 [Acinetobacter genomosp. 33YU]